MSAMAWSRQHWLFGFVAVGATALRAVVLLAYQPALIFPDSERYLAYAWRFLNGHWSPDWVRTSGYSLLLMPAVLTRNLAVVVAIQHLLGLATAMLIYAVLLRYGARRWLAALAAVPVLLDPLQLDLEQYVLTDVTATFLLVAALILLAWRHGNGAVAVAGALLAAATIIRESDLVVMVPAVSYLAVVIRPGRRLAARAALLLASFLIPVLGYLGWHQVPYGQFGFTGADSRFLYGRIAQFAECAGVPLPGDERPLCPRPPPARRNLDFYMWSPRSPQATLTVPAGTDREHVIGDFDRRIIEHQPLAYLKAVAGDVLYSFSPVRGAGPEHYPVWYHQFHSYFPAHPDEAATLRATTGRGPYAQPVLARFLAGYGRHFYVPGPLLAAGLALGLAGTAGLGRARRSRLRAPCLLFTAGAITAAEPPFLIAAFDWRYELPQLSLIPVAAVLGLVALTARPAGDRSIRPGRRLAGTDAAESPRAEGQRGSAASRGASAVRRYGQANAGCPVMARPTISDCTVSVPS